MDIETADEPFNFNAPSFQLRPRECRHAFSSLLSIPRHSMYAIYADQLGWFGVVWGVNVGIYGIHGVFGICFSRLGEFESTSRSDRPDLGTHLHLDLRRRAGVARLCAEAPVGAVRRLFFVGGGSASVSLFLVLLVLLLLLLRQVVPNSAGLPAKAEHGCLHPMGFGGDPAGATQPARCAYFKDLMNIAAARCGCGALKLPAWSHGQMELHHIAYQQLSNAVYLLYYILNNIFWLLVGLRADLQLLFGRGAAHFRLTSLWVFFPNPQGEQHR